MTKVLFWIPFAVCTYLALTPRTPAVVDRVPDYVLHSAAFAYLTFALWLAHFASWTVAEARAGRMPATPPTARTGARVAVWMLAYGVALEVLQGFSPPRTPELKDVFVDAIGIVVGLIAFVAFETVLRVWRGIA